MHRYYGRMQQGILENDPIPDRVIEAETPRVLPMPIAADPVVDNVIVHNNDPIHLSPNPSFNQEPLQIHEHEAVPDDGIRNWLHSNEDDLSEDNVSSLHFSQREPSAPSERTSTYDDANESIINNNTLSGSAASSLLSSARTSSVTSAHSDTILLSSDDNVSRSDGLNPTTAPRVRDIDPQQYRSVQWREVAEIRSRYQQC
jgi:hypothetical protein